MVEVRAGVRKRAAEGQRVSDVSGLRGCGRVAERVAGHGQEGVSALREEGSCWLRCDDCGKWRFLDRRSFEFFRSGGKGEGGSFLEDHFERDGCGLFDEVVLRESHCDSERTDATRADSSLAGLEDGCCEHGVGGTWVVRGQRCAEGGTDSSRPSGRGGVAAGVADQGVGVARAAGGSGGHGRGALKMQELRRPERVCFRCDMLFAHQGAVVDDGAKLQWRVLSCEGDGDDFDALRQCRWAAGAYQEGDEVLLWGAHDRQPLAAEAGAVGGFFRSGLVRKVQVVGGAIVVVGRGRKRLCRGAARWGDRLELDLHGGPLCGGPLRGVCLSRSVVEVEAEARAAWTVLPYGNKFTLRKKSVLPRRQSDWRSQLADGRLVLEVFVVPLKLVSRRVAKFDVD